LDNPSKIFKTAEADVMALVPSHQQPASLVMALDRLGLPDTAPICSGLVLQLFQAGQISVAFATQIAGLPSFMEIFASLRIPMVNGTGAEIGLTPVIAGPHRFP
jgi:hypothetical protein